MKLNLINTTAMIVSMSRTMLPQSPLLTNGGTVLKESDDLDILDLIPRWLLRSLHDLWFPNQRSFARWPLVSRAASQRHCILRKSWRVFHVRSLLGICFRDFVLPVWEYWWSAADTHLKLTTGPCSQWCSFSNWGCVWVWHCSSSICGSTMFAVCDQV